MQNPTTAKFAFIVHPRNLYDVYAKYPIFRCLPKLITEWVLRMLPPMKVGEILVGTRVKGYIISIPLVSSQILSDPELAYEKIRHALKLSQKYGAKIVGLGALTSSITRGGEDLVGKVGIAITNGNSLTAAVTYEAVKNLAARYDKDLLKIRIAIIGATGSVGRAVTLLLVQNGAQNLLLVGKTRANLEESRKHISIHYHKDVSITTNLARVVEADFVIVGTNAPDAFITSKHLRQGAIVYDITQPRNVSRDVKINRKDVRVIDGGIVTIPDIKPSPIFGLEGQSVFACVAETILLTLEGNFQNFSIGKVQVDDAKKIWQLAVKYNFTIASFRSFGEPII
ncbi:MAG: NAD(P)-binding domain-containing protein [Candidatus Spechtbacterales bacterium]